MSDTIFDDELPRARLSLLLQYFSKLDDEREPWRVMYPLLEVLLLLTCATIASCDDFDDIAAWGNHHLRLPAEGGGFPPRSSVRALAALPGQPGRSDRVRAASRTGWTVARPGPDPSTCTTRDGWRLWLAIHLGTVLALFVTLPYGKFAHGIYRAAALLKFNIKKRMPGRRRRGIAPHPVRHCGRGSAMAGSTSTQRADRPGPIVTSGGSPAVQIGWA
jgi:hypothetical protein